ncbi:FdhF/YdeP family oxidoreductase [Marinilongibacter aquaticus]|uniref:FdhF/YdeP family oxidoreductase n=1 Tax=Marinilongibacter aquaticus TaxID=2975157 RepID=UPI0021BD5FC3|nr:FdhF/YdeP family oxidoreductase [Marinilongibacter aquaticus]UBM59085.1 FdhF/YdeP family oxidoreductase [Marinilongibacter aquaticus]
MKTPNYIGGWKSIFYSLHVMREVGFGEFSKAIVSKNTCKTCAYGMGGQSGGMVNEAGTKLEICKKSMQAQLTDIQKPIPQTLWASESLDSLAEKSALELERLGRLNTPLYKKKGDTHYRPLSWAAAMEKLIDKFKACPPERSFFYSSGRSSNEAAFLLQLFARIYGTNNVNNCSYYCHQASGVGMKSTLGTGTATVQVHDIKQADLIFVIGANPASNHPRFVTELLHCRRRGGKVIVINPAKEPGLVRFVIPSDPRSMMSTGSAIASSYIQPKIGGDMALLYGIAKALIAQNQTNSEFISAFTDNFEAYSYFINGLSWDEITAQSGVDQSIIEDLAVQYANAENVVFSWAMGITHHRHGVENVEAIANLAMLGGQLGKRGAGLLPLRGHSNVQGIGSVGFTPTLKNQIFESIEKNLKVVLPQSLGWNTMECMQKAHEGEVDLAFVLGGNLYASNPNLNFAEKALDKIPFKVFLNSTLNSGHLKGVSQEALILPVLVRDEEKQKTTQESMFNFVRLSDGGIHRLDNCRSEVQIISELAAAVIATEHFDFRPFQQHRNIRQAIAQCIPGFGQMQKIDDTKEEFQIEGRSFHLPYFNTENGKAKFVVNPLPEQKKTDGSFRLMSVRSEGQFNSIVYEEKDSWRGTSHRKVILMNPTDMQNLDLQDGSPIAVKSAVGELQGFEAQAFDITAGCVMGFYPETNVLVGSELDPKSKTPSFKNTEVWIKKGI